MEQAIWLLLPIVVAFGSALITYVLMRDKIDIAVAEERQQTVAARALLEAQKESFEERLIALRDLARCQTQLEYLSMHTNPVNTEPKLLESGYLAGK